MRSNSFGQAGSGGHVRRVLAAMLVAITLSLGVPIVIEAPAAAAETCNTAAEVRVKESAFGTVLYRWRHTMEVCVDQNPSYWTITSAYSWIAAWDIDATWSHQGLSTSNNTNQYYLGLWTQASHDRTGHFKQCIWIWCNNLYAYANLYGQSNGNIYISGGGDG
jgi:hypothetical protein